MVWWTVRKSRWADAQGKLDLPNDDDKAVVVSAQDVFDCFSTLDDGLGSTQSPTDKIRTKLIESMGH